MGFYFIVFIIAIVCAVWLMADRMKKGKNVNPIAFFALALGVLAGIFLFWIGFNLGYHDHGEEMTTAAPTASVQTTAKIQK